MAFKSLLGLGSMAALASGHAIFQELSVDGLNQGVLKGIRAPDSNSPIQDVNSPGFACNIGINHKDDAIIPIPAGAEVGAFWGHVIGGEQFPDDPDNPIAISHKGKFDAWTGI
jgi:lytic cellulose monooxygenase (C1-hydroxylating)